MPEGSIEPHLCRNAIYHCPSGTGNTDLVELCELGPLRLTDLSENDGHVFRNRFCAECWNNTELPELPVTENEELWDNTTLVILQPVIQNTSFSEFKALYGLQPQTLPQFFAHLNNDTWREYKQGDAVELASNDRPSWDLGSIRCDSDFPEVCAHFIKFPEDEDVCSGPGCGADKVQDAFGTCLDPSEYQYSDDWRKDEDFIWPEWLLMKYDNLCSSQKKKSCQ